jgi:hypothetical protein
MEKSLKNLDFYYFFKLPFDFLSVKTDVNVPSKSNRQKIFEKTLILLPSCQPLMKKAGSRESGSVSQCYEHRSGSVPTCYGSTTLGSTSLPLKELQRYCGAHGNFPLLRALLNLFKRRSRP